MASFCLMGFKLSSNSYTSGTAVGMFNSDTTSSESPSRYFTSPRRELPWAAMTTLLPDRMAGAISLCQYGSTRSRVVCDKGKTRPYQQSTHVLYEWCRADLETLCANLQRLRVACVLGAAGWMVLRGQLALRRRYIVRSTPQVHLQIRHQKVTNKSYF